MSSKSTLYLLSAVLGFGLFLGACSVEKNTAATRNFHNLTSHYNIYFNGNESYKEGLLRAEKSIQDNFTKILPLFYYEDESIRQAISPQMQRAIDKASKVAIFHSITAKPEVKPGRQTEKQKAFYEQKEYNKWMDDSYLLVGKSNMYKGDFFLAAESFKHVIKTFPGEETYYSALVWLARVNSYTGELAAAEEILVNLAGMEEFPKNLKSDLYTTLTDYYLRKKSYAKAAESMEMALQTKLKKNTRVRYTFILAQIYHELKNSDQSIKNYRKVVRMNPPYEMSFNAKVSMASAFQAGTSGSGEIKKLLNKMLRDSKNTDYLDQIYYALGNIAMEEGEREKAIDYYHKSVSSSVQNNFQKGESCLTLAKIYYEQPLYTMSAAYYDTAVNLLATDHPEYNTLTIRSRSLNSLVKNVHVFELQDSVQVLAGMSEGERFAVIDGIIAGIREKEAEAQRKEQEALEDLQYNRSGMYSSATGTGAQQTGGKWYFYNLNAKSFGQPEFRMKWGDRKLEDNWRRSNKQSVTALLEENGENGAEGTGGAAIALFDNKSREFYLRNIPLTDSAMAQSHLLLEEALYNMGVIYQTDLLDYGKAIESLEEVVKRYPDGNYTMPAAYHLYELFNIQQQPSRAEYYKNLLSRKYPDSHMAKLLTNPNYINELEAQANISERYYASVYENYMKNNFEAVLRDVEYGFREYGDDEQLVMRLLYLKAMSTGAVIGKEEMKVQLDTLVALYPNTEIGAEAREIIEYMYVAFPVIKEADLVKVATELYTYDPGANHYFLIALRAGEDLNLLNFNLLNYNIDYYAAYDLPIALTQLGAGFNLLMVSGFSDVEGVNRYAGKAKADAREIVGEMSAEAYKMVTISEANYQSLLKAKEFVPYLLFYNKFYTGN